MSVFLCAGPGSCGCGSFSAQQTVPRVSGRLSFAFSFNFVLLLPFCSDERAFSFLLRGQTFCFGTFKRIKVEAN